MTQKKETGLKYPIRKKKRLPYQVLVLPFIKENDVYLYAIFKRRDLEFWQGVSGGGEDVETPFETAKRETFEEIQTSCDFVKLDAMATIPSVNIGNYKWDKVFVVPEYAFGAKVFSMDLKIGHEHSEYRWLPYNMALKLLKYDSNKTALWELNKRLTEGETGGESIVRSSKARLLKKRN